MLRRKSQVLMDILTSGDKVETVIAQHTEEIDKQLIQMLDERIRAGMRCFLIYRGCGDERGGVRNAMLNDVPGLWQ